MLQTRLDHLVVAANSLEEGSEWTEHQLGVRVPRGGRHEMMGTHNRVMALGQNTYLEIIAVNPKMQSPAGPRWFGLDDSAVIMSLADSPKLLTWAVNTNDLTSLVRASRIVIGDIHQFQRDELRWKIALPDDGRLIAGGFFPLCIEWLLNFHPASRMPDFDFRLESLTLYHCYPQWLHGMLSAIGAETAVTIKKAKDRSDVRLAARIASPTGKIEISGWGISN